MIKTKILRKYQFTPLRYPGGKTSLFEFFDEVIKKNDLKKIEYVEPYAGGAGAALALLLLGRVDKIVINDYDKAIFSFWQSILHETDDFIKKIECTPLTIEEWDKQRKIYRNESAPILDRGFASFFLNRTNRSGILTGGPIGGKAQTGKWLLDARYNKQKLIEKVRFIAQHKDKITVLNKDGLDVIRLYSKHKNAFFYIDPPYYDKGASLYLNSYKHEDHASLASLLNRLGTTKWILSYDNVSQIRDLYQARVKQFEFSLHYQAHSSRNGSELIVFSDALEFPNSAE